MTAGALVVRAVFGWCLDGHCADCLGTFGPTHDGRRHECSHSCHAAAAGELEPAGGLW